MSTITKRPGYSIIRETPPEERGREIAKLIKTNPKAMLYFKKRNPVIRIGEIIKMVVSTESHSRKEVLRSSLYPIAEQHFKDNKMRDVNIEGAVKEVLADAKKEIMSKEVRNAEDVASLKVIDEMLKKENEIDSSKILKDKEKWWRRILRTLAAAALGVALMLPFMSREGDVKPKVVEKRVEDPETKESLNACLNALANTKCPSPKVVYKEEKIDLDKACSERTGPLAQSLLACEEKLSKMGNVEEMKKQLLELEKLKKDSENYTRFKLHLMGKVDRVFHGLGLENEKELYYKKIRPWFKKGIDNDDEVMMLLVIDMGGELLAQEIKDEKVVKIRPPQSSKEFADILEEGKLAYLYGIALDNNKGNRRNGMKKAAWEYYMGKYEQFKKVLEKPNHDVPDR